MKEEHFQNPVAAEPARMAVLAVDDDADIHIVMRPYLEQQRYSYLAACDGDEMMEKIAAQRPDVILLDVRLPGKDGLELMSDIRNVTKAPIILLSGSACENTRIAGLEMGADDFMTKPVELRELTARIKAILRRSGTDEDREQTPVKDQRLHFGGWTLDRQQYQLLDKNGKSADLTLGEYRLLEALIMAPGSVLSREQLFELTRASNPDSGDRVIDAQIARLRKKLQGGNPSRSIIKTVRKIGYMFCGKLGEKEAAIIR